MFEFFFHVSALKLENVGFTESFKNVIFIFSLVICPVNVFRIFNQDFMFNISSRIKGNYKRYEKVKKNRKEQERVVTNVVYSEQVSFENN